VNEKNQRGRTLLHLLFENDHLMNADDERILLANIDVLFQAGIHVNAQDEGEEKFNTNFEIEFISQKGLRHFHWPFGIENI